MIPNVSSRVPARLLAVAFSIPPIGFEVHAQSAGELTVDTVAQEINGPVVLTGDLFPIDSGDLAFESGSQRNALVVYGGATLTLKEGADVGVRNDNNLTAFLRVGYGTAGSLVIENGASLAVGSATRYANMQIGQGATGTVTQTGGAVTAIGSFNVGVNGGTGTYTINGGSLTFDHAGPSATNRTSLISIGFNNSTDAAGTSTGVFNIDGGLVELKPVQTPGVGEVGTGIGFIIGNRAKDALAAYSGSPTNVDNAGPGNGTVTQTGGVFRVGAGANLFLSGYGNGTYDLNGGTLEIGGGSLQAKYGNHSQYTYDFTLGGGTIKVLGSALDTSVNATLADGTTSTFDTNGLGATWRGSLTGGGALLKTGAQKLTLAGAANDFGVLEVRTGGVSVTTGSTTVTRVLVGASGTEANGLLEISGGTVNTTGSADSNLRTTYIGSGAGNTGELLISGGTLNVGLASTPSTRADFEVGSFQGEGSVTQTGGAVVLNSTGGYFHIGNQGTGVYTLTNGSITTQNAFVLGRSTASGMGDGTFNISGGTLTLASSTKGALIVGGVDAANTVTGGRGVINQTGGTVKVGQYLELGTKGGDGTYNLHGGTLEVGGAGGITRDATGTYAFNLGGGTIKVTGTALTSGLDFNVVDRDPGSGLTQSFINTNGLGASFSGDLTGGGTLVKTGLGTLTLSGDSNLTGEAYVTGGSINQTAGGSTIKYLAVGSGSGADGGYALSGGTLSITQALQVGDWGGAGAFNQTGGTVNVAGSFNVGNQGGTGTYNLSAGALNLSGGLYSLGRNTDTKPASSGTFNLSGTGVLNVAGGNFVIGNRDATATNGNGAGVFNQTGGVFRISGTTGADNLFLSGYGNGVYNLLGGVLEIGGDRLRANYGGTGTYAFNLGGGTIRAINSAIVTSVNATLVDGTVSYIDTNGLGATFSGAFDGDAAGLIKVGAGTLTLSGAGARTLGYFNTDEGTTAQTAGTTTSAEFVVGSNYAAKNGVFTLGGGTVEIQGTGTSSLRVGDFGGTGVFTQTGGTVRIGSATHAAALNIGNQGGTGTYNLNGGTLELAGGLNVIGRSAGSNPVSNGALNIGGVSTLLEIKNGSSLIIGNNFVRDSYGTSTVTQTGGTVRVTDGTIFVAGFGAGTYNLGGGTLEVGGDNLRARYNNTTAASAFNFGGGTIKVIGENLSTDVETTLVAATASTVDTNGFDATFSKALTGAGSLIKTGLGQLTLSGTNTFGGLAARQGTVTNGSGTTTVGTLGIGADGADGATYALTNGVLNVLRGDPDRGELTVGGGAGGSGTLTISGGQLNVGDAGSFSRFFVGAYDGTGVVNQSGGTVNTSGPFNIGNRGGHGTYALTAGTLNVGQYPAAGDSNALILGRSRTGQQTNVSKGYLTIGGTGSLVLNTNTPLLIGGDSGSTASLSEGHVTQTGGTVTVNSWIDLGSKGYGEYTLNGGTLQIGGVNGLRSTSGDYDFNLGGGTLKVINSHLVTGVRGRLAAATVSTVNTNGFNATLSNGVTGQGGLAKTGAGVLILQGTSDHAGGTTVSAGTLQVDGVVETSAITVGADATLSGHGTAADVDILAGGELILGGTPGGFTIDGDLSLATGSYTLLQIASLEAHDYLAVTGTLYAGGVLDVDFLSGFNVVEGDSFALFNASVFDGTFADVWLPVLTAGLEWNTGSLYTTGEISVVASAVPEPAAFAVLAGAAALVPALCRRRRERA